MTQAVEHPACSRTHHAAPARKRSALSGDQCADAVVGSAGEGLRLAHLDDVQTSAGTDARCAQGEQGSLVTYVDKIIRTETDSATGEEAERAIPFMKGYTVFDVDQIDGLPEHYRAKPVSRSDTIQRIEQAESFFAGAGTVIRHGEHGLLQYLARLCADGAP